MADTKITALDANAGLVATDLIVVVDDPAGTPATQKATVSQIKDYLVALANTWTAQNTFASGAITTSQPLTVTQTWNDAGVTFTGIKANVTDTTSAAASLLMDLQVGGTSKFKVTKTGVATFGSDTGVDGANGTISCYPYVAIGASYTGVKLASTQAVNWAQTADFTDTTDLTLARDAANVLAQRNSTNAQTFRVYNTYTDGSNYERALLQWDSNVFLVGTHNAGTGSSRVLRLGSTSDIEVQPGYVAAWKFTSAGNLICPSDNTYDIGASGATRPRNLHLGGYIAGSVQSLTGAGAINLTTHTTALTTTGADALTLADGVVGQIKYIVVVSDGGTGTLTPTNLANGTTLTFADVGDSVILQFIGTEWHVIANNGAVLA
jgi:hypothetical protein